MNALRMVADAQVVDTPGCAFFFFFFFFYSPILLHIRLPLLRENGVIAAILS